MVWKKHKYDELPGTYVFDGKHAHSAYAMNKLLFSFNTEKNRAEYEADPAAYCDKFKLPEEHKQYFLNNDFLGMLRAGANIYYMAKMAIPRVVSVQDCGAQFQGVTTEEFIAKLLAKRDGLEERLEKEEGYWNG